MQGELLFSEDVRQIAADAAELAPSLCDTCENFHTLWPYHRLAQAAGGDVAATLVCSTLQRLLSQPGRRILIGGSADSGLLAVVANAASPGTAITVLDKCKTPLELCRRFAERWSLPIDVLHLDLADLEATGAYDVVFVHMLLQFIPRDRHRGVLSRIRRSLRADGRLVLVFRTSPRLTETLAAEYQSDYPLGLIEQLEARGIPLPQSRESFRRQLEIYFDERRAREGTHNSHEDVERTAKDAGFRIEELTAIGASMSSPFTQFNARIGLQRFLMIAAPDGQS
jgi:SAM-dependent methyltransferase